MTPAIDEIKTRARLQVNAGRRAGHACKLRDCLQTVARELGFSHWEHARRVLVGLAAPGDDMGGLWHVPACNAYLNQWFADGLTARLAREKSGGYLLPYRRQFVVVQAEYIRELGLDPANAAWADIGRDLVAAYASDGWRALCGDRVKATARTLTSG